MYGKIKPDPHPVSKRWILKGTQSMKIVVPEAHNPCGSTGRRRGMPSGHSGTCWINSGTPNGLTCT